PREAVVGLDVVQPHERHAGGVDLTVGREGSHSPDDPGFEAREHEELGRWLEGDARAAPPALVAPGHRDAAAALEAADAAARVADRDRVEAAHLARSRHHRHAVAN